MQIPDRDVACINDGSTKLMKRKYLFIKFQALTSGSIPGFVDVVLNFDSRALQDDNIITQVKAPFLHSTQASIKIRFTSSTVAVLIERR